MSLLKQDTTKEEQVEKVLKLDVGDKGNEEYEVETIWNNAVYAKESEGHLPGLYYLVAWKGYPKKENT